MKWSNIIQTIIFLCLIGPGIVGNILMFVRQVYTSALGTEKKPVDLILIHLAFSNMIIICTTGIRDIATVFYFRNFLGDTGCKAVVYLARMARGLSICTTCLLSVVQAVTIGLGTTSWRKFKPQTSWQVLIYVLLFWIFNALTSSNLLYYVTAGSGLNRSGVAGYIGYCYMLPSMDTVKWLFLSLMAVRDLIFQSLMGWSSGHISFYLYKHHKQVLYLHSCRSVNSFSPEIKAAQSVLILMACFLVFYWADFIFSFYTGSMVTHNSIILNIKTCLVLGYAVLSPFVLMSRAVPVAKALCSH
ncbi:putative vomeronasal receptor-like protein 4 [Peromyscus californicus insignis]|uniref:putative vomeronasal receptor-like protein 4 n=1 Tax=Peromyscus californicus insignis TaxID=564181 RepID=UPI0022A80776|nr:putative vomeronasal receptor-like protein 4 [Peromyscus californicus insignis]